MASLKSQYDEFNLIDSLLEAKSLDIPAICRYTIQNACATLD